MAARRRGRGEGSIEQLPSGKFRVVLSLGTDPVTKKQRKATATFPTKREALAWRAEQQAARGKGQLADAGRLTVGGWLDQWLAYKRDRVQTRTWEPYESHVRLHLRDRIGSIRLAELRPHHVAGLYAGLTAAGVSAPQQRKIGGTLRTALEDAVRQQKIATNPAKAVARPRASKPEMTVWTPTEVQRFGAECAADRLGPLFLTALDTGMRQGELFGLHWPELYLDAGAVRVVYSLERTNKSELRRKEVKTKHSRRRVALSPAAVAVLRRHREAMRLEGHDVEAGPVFCNTAGGWLRAANVQHRHFDPTVQRAGVTPIRFHDLRHTHATLALAAGANLRAVSARLGHGSAAFTLAVYTHALPEQDQAIAGIWGGLLDNPTAIPRDGNASATVEVESPEDAAA
jgi:integrase